MRPTRPPVALPASAPLRVAFLNDIGGLGGAEMVQLLLARRLPRARFTPVYFAPAPGPMAEEMRAAGAEVVAAGRGRWWSTSFYLGRRKLLNPLAVLYDAALVLAYVRKLARALRAAGIDVVYSSGMSAPVAGGLAARRLRLPHVAHVHDIITRRPVRWVYQRVLERVADGIVAISRAVAAGYTPARTVIIPNAVDLDRGTGMVDWRDRLGIKPDQKLVGMAGRLTPWKGQHVFLQAAKRLAAHATQRNQADRYRFVLVGDDVVGGVAGYREALERLAAEEPLRGRVEFLGRRPDVLAVMKACDVLVHASTSPEPFGLVIIEAMAVGTPVVATALGGPLEILTHGVDGLLVAPGEPGALADAVRSLCDHPEEARRMADRARAKCRSEYSADLMTDRFAALLDRLVDKHVGGPARAARAVCP